jgi:hypothetical protein
MLGGGSHPFAGVNFCLRSSRFYLGHQRCRECVETERIALRMQVLTLAFAIGTVEVFSSRD